MKITTNIPVADLVSSLGCIIPTGEEYVDDIRFDNLVEVCALIDRLIFKVTDVSTNKGRSEYSVNKAGEYAYNYMKELHQSLGEDLEELGWYDNGVYKRKYQEQYRIHG